LLIALLFELAVHSSSRVLFLLVSLVTGAVEQGLGEVLLDLNKLVLLSEWVQLVLNSLLHNWLPGFV